MGIGRASRTGRPWWRGAAIILVSMLVLAAVFVQIERGTGNRSQVLLFTLFDLLLVAALFATLLGLTRRWRISLLAASLLVLLVYLGSWLKMQHMAAAAQASDLINLYSAWDLVKSFAWPAIAGSAAIAAVIALLLAIEKPLYARSGSRALLLVLGALLFVFCARLDDRVPRDDHRLLSTGPGPKIALFYRSIYETPTLQAAAFPGLGSHCCMIVNDAPAVAFHGAVKPNLVVVLQESTFAPSLLRGYSDGGGFLLDGAAPLMVHVQGGGTWVEEFSILHGVPATAYGDDYMQVQWLGPAMGLRGRLAPMLARQGYETTTVYPTGRQVLGSEALHRSLGMKRFVGCPEIARCLKGAQWNKTPDSVFFDEVLKVLQDEDKPAFVFTATMRQHSPHVERFPLKHHQQEVMQEYKRRLDLSSEEARAFVSALRQLRRPTIVLMFGDHLPSDVVAAFGEHEFAGDAFQTFFNLYDTDGSARAAELMARFPGVGAVDSAFLDALLLDFAGFTGDYIDTKLKFMQMCGGRFCGKAPTVRPLAGTTR